MFLQFSNSPKLQSLVSGLTEANNQKKYFELFTSYFFKLSTAGTAGIDWWGDKLQIPRYMNLRYPPEIALGFKGAFFGNMSFANFAKYTPDTSYRRVEDNVFRLLLKLAFIKTFSAPSLGNFVAMLNSILGGRGKVRIDEISPMQVRVVYFAALYYWERAVITNREYLPIPMAVGFTFNVVNNKEVFGFAGQKMTNFYRAFFVKNIV